MKQGKRHGATKIEGGPPRSRVGRWRIVALPHLLEHSLNSAQLLVTLFEGADKPLWVRFAS